jgi:hypothetical protein
MLPHDAIAWRIAGEIRELRMPSQVRTHVPAVCKAASSGCKQPPGAELASQTISGLGHGYAPEWLIWAPYARLTHDSP